MRLLVIGDPHYKRTNKEETDMLESEVSKLIPSVDRVVVLGDVLDRFSLRALCRVNTWLVSLSTRVPLTVLVGNHEREDNTDYLSEVHPYVGMERPNLKVISSPVVEDGILYMPYVAPGRFDEALETVPSKLRLIFCHQSFVGCSDPKSLDRWDRDTKVISGHIHDRTVLYRGRATTLSSEWNVYYPGAPLCNTFGDEIQRYVCIVDTDTLEVEELPIKSIGRSVRTIGKNYTEEDLDFLERADKYCRVEIVGTHAECNELRMSSQVIDARKRGCDVKTVPFAAEPSVVRRDNVSFMSRWLEKLESNLDAEGVLYIKSLID